MLDNRNGLFQLAKFFHHGSQHWPHHVDSRSVLAAQMASNLRWRQQFTEHALRLLQTLTFFPVQVKPKRMWSSFLFFVMMKGYDDNQKSFCCYLHSQLRGTDIHVSPS